VFRDSVWMVVTCVSMCPKSKYQPLSFSTLLDSVYFCSHLWARRTYFWKSTVLGSDTINDAQSVFASKCSNGTQNNSLSFTATVYNLPYQLTRSLWPRPESLVSAAVSKYSLNKLHEGAAPTMPCNWFPRIETFFISALVVISAV